MGRTMNRALVVLALISVTATLGCNQRSDQVTASESQSEGAAASKPVSKSIPSSSDARDAAPSAPTIAQQRCEALEDNWEELDPSYAPEWKEFEHTDNNRDRRIEKRGFTDSPTYI
jgi:hypothetical protein